MLHGESLLEKGQSKKRSVEESKGCLKTNKKKKQESKSHVNLQQIRREHHLHDRMTERESFLLLDREIVEA